MQVHQRAVLADHSVASGILQTLDGVACSVSGVLGFNRCACEAHAWLSQRTWQRPCHRRVTCCAFSALSCCSRHSCSRVPLATSRSPASLRPGAPTRLPQSERASRLHVRAVSRQGTKPGSKGLVPVAILYMSWVSTPGCTVPQSIAFAFQILYLKQVRSVRRRQTDALAARDCAPSIKSSSVGRYCTHCGALQAGTECAARQR